jgi:hypothetical protein
MYEDFITDAEVSEVVDDENIDESFPLAEESAEAVVDEDQDEIAVPLEVLTEEPVEEDIEVSEVCEDSEEVPEEIA